MVSPGLQLTPPGFQWGPDYPALSSLDFWVGHMQKQAREW